MLQRDELLEIADELVVLRFFMATAISTIPKSKGKNGSAATMGKRMSRLAELEDKLRAAAKEPT